MMLKVVVFGYATGVFSSRKIERKLHDDLAFRMLGAGNFPKHRRIRDFRALHLKELSDLFVQVVRLVREMGLVKLGTVAIDGTKLNANASRLKAMSYEHMQQAEVELKAQIDALLESAKSTDEAEADEPDLDIPAEVARRVTRLRAIIEAREPLEQRQRDADIERERSPGDDRKPQAASRKPQAASRTTATATATPRAGASSAISACPIPRRKTTSPTPPSLYEALRRRARCEPRRPNGGRRHGPVRRGR